MGSKPLDAARRYCQSSVAGNIETPKYVKKQCAEFLRIIDGKTPYTVDRAKVRLIDGLTKLMTMPKGLKAGMVINDVLSDFQWFFIVAPLCVVYKNEPTKRRYETVLLEIARKNAKTFIIGIIFILLFFMEPKFSKFYSVAPDGKLSREVQTAIKEILKSSPALSAKFKLKRDEYVCLLNDSVYIPLNYSNDKLDGKLPNVFLADEVGALPNSYAIEAMRSGQLTILNKLGCIISTKYPKETNPFEAEVNYAKRVLDGIVEDEALFALLYEPDSPKEWASSDKVLMHANPLALDVPEIWNDLIKKRRRAVEMESARANFLNKHCNINYAGKSTESYVSIEELRKGRVEKIEWSARKVWLGLDLAITEDNCGSVWIAESEDGGLDVWAEGYFPADRLDEKSETEKFDYRASVDNGECFDCGGSIIGYGFIEEHLIKTAKAQSFDVQGFGFDRYNCISTAQKLESEGWEGTIVAQHSLTTHPAVKYIAELIAENKLHYTKNSLLEVNFENARCTYDTNLNRYVDKKRSSGKVDLVAALIDAVVVYLKDKEDGESFVFQC